MRTYFFNFGAVGAQTNDETSSSACCYASVPLRWASAFHEASNDQYEGRGKAWTRFNDASLALQVLV